MCVVSHEQTSAIRPSLQDHRLFGVPGLRMGGLRMRAQFTRSSDRMPSTHIEQGSARADSHSGSPDGIVDIRASSRGLDSVALLLGMPLLQSGTQEGHWGHCSRQRLLPSPVRP